MWVLRYHINGKESSVHRDYVENDDLGFTNNFHVFISYPSWGITSVRFQTPFSVHLRILTRFWMKLWSKNICILLEASNRMAYIHPSSYAIEIRNSFRALKRTIDLYRDAITYLLTPVMEHWDEVSAITGSNLRMNYIESIVHIWSLAYQRCHRTVMSRHKSLVHLVPSGQERLVLSAWMDTVSAWRRKSEAPQVPWKPLPLSVSVGRGGSPAIFMIV